MEEEENGVVSGMEALEAASAGFEASVPEEALGEPEFVPQEPAPEIAAPGVRSALFYAENGVAPSTRGDTAADGSSSEDTSDEWRVYYSFW